MGLLVTGIAVIAIPFFSTMYPAFLIIRITLSLGTSIGLNVPLLPDYVQNGSMGLANGYCQVVITLAFIFSSSGLMTLGKAVPEQSYIYYGTGGVIIFIAIFLTYGIKDVIIKNDSSNSTVEYTLDKNSLISRETIVRPSLRDVLKELFHELKTDAGFILSITGITANKIMSIAVNQFGTILVSESMEK